MQQKPRTPSEDKSASEASQSLACADCAVPMPVESKHAGRRAAAERGAVANLNVVLSAPQCCGHADDKQQVAMHRPTMAHVHREGITERFQVLPHLALALAACPELSLLGTSECDRLPSHQHPRPAVLAAAHEDRTTSAGDCLLAKLPKAAVGSPRTTCSSLAPQRASAWHWHANSLQKVPTATAATMLPG